MGEDGLEQELAREQNMTLNMQVEQLEQELNNLHQQQAQARCDYSRMRQDYI